MTRREALGALGLLALSSRMAFGAGGAQQAGIALQLYTVRDAAKKDLEGTLKKAYDMGWRYVQWSGMPNLPADQIRAALDKAGLKCIACHTSIEAFEKNFDEQVSFWKTVGNKDVAPGGMMKDCTKDLESWLKGCKRLDELGAKLRGVGMRLSFHNHAHEFEKFPNDPRTKHQILMDSTKPENLCAELDIAWACAAGVDVPAYIRSLKGRIPVVHAKDVLNEAAPAKPAKGAKGDGKKHTLMPLGQGQVPWKDVFAAGKAAGVEWYIYEQDNGKGEVWDYVKTSYDFIAKQSL
jgi:sugar phosphate isomerase/epimerase